VIVMDLDLSQARRRAKELLRAAQSGDEAALARMRPDRAPRLADAQHAIANDLDFPSWPALVAHVEASQGDREERRRRLVSAALEGRPDIAERLLEHDPELSGFDVALVLGDVDSVRAALDADPGLIEREVQHTGKLPLSCACHSAFLSPSSGRAPGVRSTVRLLLDRGSDPNEVFHNEFGAMPVLYGAAGVARDPETTRLLLERGANPDDGESVYHASETDDTTCLEILLDHGATVRDTNALGNAIRSAKRVRVLLEKGDLRPEDSELRNSLLLAKEDDVARLLIEHGAALDVRDEDGLTPYSVAARRGDTSLMELLADAGAHTELDPVAEWIGAVAQGDDEHAARCLAADPDLPQKLRPNDMELLPMWASAGLDEGVKRLVAAGVPLDARGIDNGTALHYAGMWGRGNTVGVLLALGADPNVTAFRDTTPLGWTAWGSRHLPETEERMDGYLEAARRLIEAGARVTDGMVGEAADELSVLLEQALAASPESQLADALESWGERGEIDLDTGLRYAPEQPVRVRVRKRERRYDIDDGGRAVGAAGKPHGWFERAQQVVDEHALNVNRSGSVFVPAVEGRDIYALVVKVADASVAVHAALLELDDVES
jgi:ankyrin repeat protein